ncbi:hypothetical protein ABPG72_013833 [Tetrahymena utriculariae]
MLNKKKEKLKRISQAECDYFTEIYDTFSNCQENLGLEQQKCQQILSKQSQKDLINKDVEDNYNSNRNKKHAQETKKDIQYGDINLKKQEKKDAWKNLISS